MLCVLICRVHLTVCYYHVRYGFQSDSTLYICLNGKEILARNRRDISSLSDYNGTPTHNHIVRKWTLNHLAKLTEWLSCVVSTYLYGAFDCRLLSCHVPISEWVHALYLLECQGSHFLKLVRYLKFKWLQWEPKPQPISSWTNTQPFRQTNQMIELFFEYLSVRCIWLYVIIMSCTQFRVHPHSIFAWIWRNSLLETRATCEVWVTITGLEPTTT